VAGLVVALGLAMAGIAYALSLSAGSMIMTFAKVAPAAVSLGLLALFGLVAATSSDNLIFAAFQGRVHLPELICILAVTVLTLALAWFMAHRERRLDR
jgi:cytochrome bd-type quinol oxidase subunit 2